ncbi:hypothetical protein ABMA32_03545 [Mesorhizobium sp. VNQ89]|uniref:hypothetical protein n=1 Tax=Mesorhizobium quangtriensis TaxID=3157709 RepID=UPI0032B76FE5
MARKSKGLPLQNGTDTADMASAIKALQQRGVAVWRPSIYQLKIGDLNFWPATGRITRDAAPKITRQGLDALLKMLPGPTLTLEHDE